ncbi:MAG: ABC transporter ATP-binding protein [Candidatus Hydrogenedentota bacterium]
MAIIEAYHIYKTYPTRRGTRVMLGRGGIGDWLRGRRAERFDALEDINLTVDPGESLGIIGRNGSGKSTLLKILAGVTLPTRGEVIARGRVASLLELGAGFHPMLTGRENVYLNAGLLGMRHAQVDQVFDEIVNFSGIGEFIDQPVDTYSSGMYVRIGFAVAAHTNPDIFLVDEVLAVGDEEFQRKCRRKIGELRAQGKTIVFVSHDLGIVNTLCERIVLLNKGRMIVRETAQKTINYYLRQVGRDRGVHTFGDGDLEVIHCDGRLSLFKQQEEISSATGFIMNLTSLGQRHPSSDAEWEVTQAGPNYCTVRGRMTRLPVTLVWVLAVNNGRLSWDISLECEHGAELTQIEAVLFLPTEYKQWIYGDLSGTFPDILPSDMNWNALVAPEQSETHVAALPGTGSALPPLLFELAAQHTFFRLYWANSEYVQFSRVLAVQGIFPSDEATFGAGLHRLATLDVDSTARQEDVRAQVQRTRTVEAGRLTARFERGRVLLAVDGQTITHFLHLYGSMLVEHLWHDSMSLQWGGPTVESAGLHIHGASRRFPFQQTWHIAPAGDGALAVNVWLEVREPMEVQEYHLSVALQPAYERWVTDHEAGAFPPFDRSASTWQHVNRSYAPGNRATALSSTLPSVTLKVTTEDIPFRMTVINTRHNENARVLQALRPSERGLLHFEPGRHLYFRGIIRVGDDPAPDTGGAL